MREEYYPLSEDTKQEVLRNFPNESCGFIVDDGKFIPAQNQHVDKEHAFRISREDFVSVRENHKIKYIIHSHCRDPETDYGMISKYDIRTPSAMDVATQKSLGIPFIIAGSDGETVLDDGVILDPSNRNRPLLGRNFIWYINDCWTMVRDYYWQKRKVDLGFHHHTFDWYNNGEGVVFPFYKYFLERWGFVEIDESELQEGDIVVMGIQGDYNHIGIWTKDFNVLQTMIGRPSREFPYRAMKSYVQLFARYSK